MLCRFNKSIYRDQSNGYSVCRFTTDDDSVPTGARDKYAPGNTIAFTAFGYGLPDTSAVDYELEGVWEPGKYGMQLAVQIIREIIPATTDGLVGYLSSGLVKGVGPKTAKAIVKKFGLDTMAILENTPDRLLEIKGISASKVQKISESVRESRTVRDLVTYLAPFGVTANKAAKILKKFKGSAMQVVKDEPFRLCDVAGFGFLTVDDIARKTHANLSASLRIRKGLEYVLKDAAVKGHLYLPQPELTQKTHALLNQGFTSELVGSSALECELRGMAAEREVMDEHGRIYLPAYRDAEITVARKTVELAGQSLCSNIDLKAELAASQNKLGITLSPRQEEAVRMCFCCGLSIITGGPGTGKTTALRVILDIYQRIRPDGRILLAAPTGRATRRMVEATGYPEASTLHSALGLVPADNDYAWQSTGSLEADLVIVDEVSMVDMLLAAELFNAVGSQTQLVLVGDPDQLPSVGPGNVLRELLRSRVVPWTQLDFVHRQAGNSRIALNAHTINQGSSKLSYGDDFQFFQADTAEAAADMVIHQYLAEAGRLGLWNVQILAPMRSRGKCSVNTLNEQIRELVNPRSPGLKELKVGARVYRVRDKVLQTKNRLLDGISNGDIGFIEDIQDDDDGEHMVLIRFGPDRLVSFSVEQLAQLELAYATTVHKSQGSECSVVILALLNEQYVLLRRNIIYTAISRAKQKLILVGQQKALRTAVSKCDVDSRNTLLADRIISYSQKRKSQQNKAI